MPRLTRIETNDSPSKDTKQELNELLEKITKNKDNIDFFEQGNGSTEQEKAFDISADSLFDDFVKINNNRIGNILKNKNITNQQKEKDIKSNFKDYLKRVGNEKLIENETDTYKAKLLFQNTMKSLNEQRGVAIELAEFQLKLELDTFKDEIENLNTTNGRLSNFNPYHGSPYEYDKEKDKQTKEQDDVIINNWEQEKYRMQEDYKEKFDIIKINYNNKDNVKRINNSDEKLENIYRDNRVSKVLADIFGADVKKGDFEINLSLQDGLGKIISELRNAVEKKNQTITFTDSDSVFDVLRKIGIYPIDKTELTKDDTKKILEDLQINYTKDGVFGDYNKLTNLFNKAKWKDLKTLLELLQSRTDIARGTKEWYNNKEVVENNIIDNNNIFEFLSDINSDGIISADDKRKNKEQYKYGDIGNISGQQIYFTIQQAIKTQDALLGDGEGERVVVKNIAKMIDMQLDEDMLTNSTKNIDAYSFTFKRTLSTLLNTPSIDGFVELINDYPQAKTLFLASLEKINGGSSVDQIDMYDVLTGQEAKRIDEIDTTKEMEDIRRSLHQFLIDNENLKSLIEKEGLINVRESLFQEIMDVIDKVSLTISFDTGTGQDMIMSDIEKTFYKEKARKQFLKNFNIQQISVGTNLKDLKLTYKIGKAHISSDGRSKYHIAGGPSFYLGKNGFAGGIDFDFSRAEQINYTKASSASLDEVKKAKYIGVEGGAGAKISKDGGGLYALLGASYEKDAIMGIQQLGKTYQNVSNILFSLDNLTNFSKESIQNYLEGNLRNLSDGIYKGFIENNSETIKGNIQFAIRYIESSGLLKQIENSDKSNNEKKEALESLIRIIQQGNIDQWKSDVIMNFHGKTELTKISAGLSTGVWFFNSKSNTYTGDGTTGSGDELPDNTDEQIISEEGGPASSTVSGGGDTKVSFLGMYLGARISTWKNKYLPNAQQLLKTEYEMNQGISDNIEMDKDLSKYAKYLEGIFNKPGLSVKANTDGTLEINYEYEGLSKLTLDKLLNIHYLPASKDNFSLDGNKLIIGNVGPITAYTTTLPSGIDRVLCLGTKNLNEAIRLEGDNKPKDNPSAIEFKENGFENLTKQELDMTIGKIKNRTTYLNSAEQTVYKNLFDADGKLITAPAGVTYKSPLVAGKQFSTGILTLYKKPDGTYILDHQPSTDNKFHIEYKTAGTTWNEIPGSKINNPDIKIQPSSITLPKAEKVAEIEIDKSGKPSEAFQSFTQAIIAADFDNAATQLQKILPKGDANITILQNGTPEQKQYIIDSYISLFAYENSYKHKTNINQLLIPREKVFLDYEGPSKKSFTDGLKKDLLEARKTFFDTYGTTSYNNLEKEKDTDNIFGYTALYRVGTKDIEGERGYAMTNMGTTNIIENSITSLENEKDAKQRIVDNLAEDETHTKLLIKQIKKSIKDPNISKYITEDNLGELITKGEIEIPNQNTTNTLDIFSKKLILNSTAIFYLLRECVNESIGLRIDEIKVVDNQEEYTYEVSPNPKHKSPFYARSNSTSGIISSERKDLSATVFKKGQEKRKTKEEKPYTGDDENGEGTELPDPNEDPDIGGGE